MHIFTRLHALDLASYSNWMVTPIFSTQYIINDLCYIQGCIRKQTCWISVQCTSIWNVLYMNIQRKYQLFNVITHNDQDLNNFLHIYFPIKPVYFSLKSLGPIDRKHGHGDNDGFVLYEYIIKQCSSFGKYTNISVMKKMSNKITGQQ